MELISCQIVTFNSEATIQACLRSASKLKSKNFEIIYIIIDNSSSDSTKKIIENERSLFGEKLYLVFENENTGFSGAHNKAIRIAKTHGASFFTLINPDLSLNEDAIINMREAFNDGYKIGAVCPLLLRCNEDFSKINNENEIIDSAGIVFTPSFRHFDRGAGEYLNDTNRIHFSRPQYVSGGSGACIMYSSDCIKELSFPENISSINLDSNSLSTNRLTNDSLGEFLDEDFFAYREDAELSLRMKWLSWRVRFQPNAIGYHVRRVTPEKRKKLSEKINLLGVQNRFLLQIQLLPILGFLLLSPMIVIRNLIVILACLLKERSSLKAFTNIKTLFPKTIKKRNWIRSKRKTSLLSFISLFYKNDINPALKLKSHITNKDLSLHVSIVSYMQSEDILKNLPQLINALKEVSKWKITITNNSPDDKDFNFLRTSYKELSNIDFIDPNDNLGFAGANNEAFKESDYDIFLVLNPDISLECGSIKKIIEVYNLYENLCALSPVLIDEETNLVQYKYLAKKLGGYLILLKNLLFLDSIYPNNPVTLNETYQDDPLLKDLLESSTSSSSNILYEIEQAAGACLFVCSKYWFQLEGFDERYHPAWFEDVDFAAKVKDSSLVSALHLGAFAKHKGGTSCHSIGRAKLLKYFYKNMSIYYKKWSEPSISFIASFIIFCSFFTRRLGLYLTAKLKNGHIDNIKSLSDDILYFFK